MELVVVIVDDVEREARQLAEMIRASLLDCDPTVITCASARELEDLLACRDLPDVIFMDVRLGEESGIDVVERLLPPGSATQVVYVSGYDESHTRVYRTEHASYLRKPLHLEDVRLAVGQALARRTGTSAAAVALRHDHVVDLVRPRDIAYAESDRRHVVVHARTGNLRVYGKLSDLEGQLPPWFVRCHQSYLINLDYVARLAQDSVRLVTGDEIPVSRRWCPSLRDALFSRIRRGTP